MTSCTKEETIVTWPRSQSSSNVRAHLCPCKPRVLPSTCIYTKPVKMWAFHIGRGLDGSSREGRLLIQFLCRQRALCDSPIKVVIRERMWKKTVDGSGEWGQVREAKGSIFLHRRPMVLCGLYEATHAALVVDMSQWLSPHWWLKHLFRESRQPCFLVDRNLKAATLQSTPA